MPASDAAAQGASDPNMTATRKRASAVELVVLASAIFGCGNRATATERVRPGEEWFLKRAVFADGRLWVLSDAGELSSIEEGDNKRVEEALPEPVLDLCQRGGSLLVVTCKVKGCARWTLRAKRDGRWSTEATVAVNGDQFVAMSCRADGVTLLSSRRVVDVSGGNASVVALSEEMGAGLVALVYVGSDRVLGGINLGEWGGGMRRIDRRFLRSRAQRGRAVGRRHRRALPDRERRGHRGPAVAAVKVGRKGLGELRSSSARPGDHGNQRPQVAQRRRADAGRALTAGYWRGGVTGSETSKRLPPPSRGTWRASPPW